MKRTLILIFNLFFGIMLNAQTNTKLYTLQNSDNFNNTIKNGNIQLIDVRTPDEYKQSHIPDAINIDIYSKDFESKISKLNKDIPVAVYCRSGKRSKMAADKLVALGYRVYDLDGGILAWKNNLSK